MDNANPWTLQPGLQHLTAHAVPEFRANEEIMAPPQPANLNYCCRPTTVVYGTAPYMAGKGAPNSLIDVEDELRPQSTSEFNRYYAQNQYDFPYQNVSCKLPQRVMNWEPQSTRSEIQNGLFLQRYCKK
tara:strand:- start:226 stop:612 length:387 start_codon:yes stop_codon:yes gene_type:complete